MHAGIRCATPCDLAQAPVCVELGQDLGIESVLQGGTFCLCACQHVMYCFVSRALCIVYELASVQNLHWVWFNLVQTDAISVVAGMQLP
jgi:hypothetical protein